MVNTTSNLKGKRKPVRGNKKVGPAVISMQRMGKQVGNNLLFEGIDWENEQYASIKAYDGSRERSEMEIE